MIELKNVNKIYDNKVHALKNINLKVEEGDIYGIIGYSGAGKSTLVRLLNGLEVATDGEVIIDGDDFNKITEGEVSPSLPPASLRKRKIRRFPFAPFIRSFAAPLCGDTPQCPEPYRIL